MSKVDYQNKVLPKI